MTMELIIECILMVLLIAACGFAGILAHRLRKLRAGQEELVAMIERFDISATTARENLDTIKANHKDIERDLHRLVARATGLVTDLSVMVNAGDNVAGRLEGAVDEVRLIGMKKTSNKPSARDRL